jgi:predicted pyridoxine 5'-phosphate oxidase superfamily flavin-nucleotide-binding protein
LVCQITGEAVVRASASSGGIRHRTSEASTHNDSPWHAGELTLQREIGVAEKLDDVGRRFLRDHLIDQHRTFFSQLPFVVLGAVDQRGDVWATLRAGYPGFLSSPDPYHLNVGLGREPTDPAENGMADGQAIALLGIELHTRRRNRLNGKIRCRDDCGFCITVGQSYGNCSRYIQLRDFEFVRESSVSAKSPVVECGELDERARRLIETADTFFVASYVDRDGGARQVDVSHKGGKPGFVQIGDDGVFTIPDFAGNRFFNTLGNFLINPKAGLVFPDFETGGLLQIAGDAEVVLHSAEIGALQGAERLWRFRPRRVVYRPAALPLRCHGQTDRPSRKS